ncbi:1,4-alpha-glucan branching enzyme, partial [Listeria monocytogenes]|nr:1,4-alpha-glucan branching enzyme [Listeria monocytogenes]
MVTKQQELTAEKDFLSGENFYVQHFLGAHQVDNGYVFRVWAPKAQQVWLVGDFNQWTDTLPMNKRPESGVWEIETNQVEAGQLYKYKVKQANGREV